MATTSKNILPGIIALLFLAVPLSHGAGPSPEKLLQSSLEPVKQAYQGHMMVTQWSDKGSKSEEFGILFVPPNRYRLEFYRPDGQIDRIVWSDGDQEHLEFPKGKKVFLGKAVKSASKRMDSVQEWNLLFTNYTLQEMGPESVAGRAARILQLVPKTKGKPSQLLWVDKKNSMILKVKRFQPNTHRAVVSQFTRLELNPHYDEALFAQSSSSSREKTPHGLDPDFMSLEEVQENTAPSSPPPRALQDGFIFESGDFFTVRGKVVRHFRYTDGLTVVSLFQTTSAVQPKEESMMKESPAPGTPSGVFHTSGPVHVVHWKTKGIHYTLVGDVTGQSLQEMASSLK